MPDRPTQPRPVPPFPEPTLVVGVGRLGLAVLERLGDDWAMLQRLRPHEALRNLRLVQVTTPEHDGRPTDFDVCWRVQEAPVRAIVEGMGHGDLPSLALDFALLRTLGLVRLADGVYELAEPVDRGAVPATADTGAPVAEIGRPFRARTVFWHVLSADPLLAVERVAELRRQNRALDRLIGRLLYRVRAGHSPETVTAAVGRVRALREGRDPSPWPWLAQAQQPHGEPAAAPERPASGDVARVERACRWGEKQLERAGLRGHLRETIRRPAVTAWQPGDAVAPYPRHVGELHRSLHAALLEQDVFDFFANLAPADRRAVRVLPARDAWHGFFDRHAGAWDVTAADGPTAPFRVRLAFVGRLALQGLVRLWDDLQKQLRRKVDVDGDARPRGVKLQRAVEQCIEILGDAVVRHQLHQDVPQLHQDVPLPAADAPAGAPRADLAGPADLPARASERLASLRAVEARSGDARDGIDALRARLRALGVPVPPEPPAPDWAILRRVDLSPEDVQADLSLDVPGGADADEPAGLEALRRTVAGVGRELFDFDYLRSWRRSPVRRSPRLTVYVVGELSEPFVRATTPTVLRMIHSALARALAPIFVEHRMGLDRALHVVPVLCMPNPADPCGAGALAESRVEGALVLEALHVLRRKLEVAPGATTCVSQVYLHSRVTDNAVHSLGRCIQNVRDFVTLFARNRLTGDGGDQALPGLDALFVGRTRADLFATFTCVMAEVPRAQLRWYAGNRLARTVVRALEEGDGAQPVPWDETDHRGRLAERMAEGVGEAVRPVRSACARAGDEARRQAKAPAPDVDPATDGEAVAVAYVRDQPRREREAVTEAWRALTADSAEMSRAIERLRVDGTRVCQADAADVRRGHDGWMERAIGAGRPVRSIERAFEDALQRADARVLEEDRTCRAQRRKCAGSGLPDPRRLEATREAVVEAARAKPAWQPMRVVLLLWALMASVLGAPLAHAAALALDLDQQPNGLEWLLGPMAPLVGVLVLWPIAFVLLRRHMDRAVARLQDAVDSHGDAAAGLFLAPAGSALALLTSRVELLRVGALFAHASALRTVVAADRSDLRRIVGSVVALRHRLQAEAERMGVRQIHPPGQDEFAVEDTGRVLDAGEDRARTWLLQGRDLGDLYASWFAGRPREEREKVAQILRFMRACDDRGRALAASTDADAVHPAWAARIAATVGLRRWREQAWLADGDAVVEACAIEFDRRGMRGWPGADERLEAELERFVLSHYPNIGFAAQFRGFEGLDEDRLAIAADAALLVDGGMLPDDRLRRYADPGATLDGAGRRPRVQVSLHEFDVEAACLLSLARDIQVESLRNLRRFENFFERARPPEDRIFPYAPGGYRPGVLLPVTLPSAHADFVEATRRAFGPAVLPVQVGVVVEPAVPDLGLAEGDVVPEAIADPDAGPAATLADAATAAEGAKRARPRRRRGDEGGEA